MIETFPNPAASAPPNILFLFPAQHRHDWLGCNPALPLRTPNLDRLCAEGTRFTRAVTPSPVCSPARACLATGREYPRCGVAGNHDNTPLSLPTYYQHLRDRGYEVSGVGKFDLHKADMDWGLDGSKLLTEYGFTRGIDNEGKGDAIKSYDQNGGRPKGPYMQFLEENGWVNTHLNMYRTLHGQKKGLSFHAVTDLPEEAYCDNWVGANALRQLRDFPKDKPWHLVVNFVGPHDPFDVTPAMHGSWKDAEFPPPSAAAQPEDEDVRVRRRHYAAMIENIDRLTGDILAEVEARGELENTLVVYASDHGEMLGDHDRWAKGVWHHPSTGIPLIVRGPGLRKGQVSEALVSLMDLAGTFLDFAGAAPLPDADTRSIRRLLQGETEAHRELLHSALGKWEMVYDGRYKWVRGWEEHPLLFDLQNDPDETRDLASALPEVCERLAALRPG